MALPTAPLAQDINLKRARMLVHAPAGAGKTQLFAGWFPKTTLVLDFDDSWSMLPGEHFRVTPKNFAEVMQIVVELTTTQHHFETVVVDTATRMWRLGDLEAGSRYGKNAAGVVEFGKGTADRDGTIMRVIAPLFASQLGVVLLAHSTQVAQDKDGKVMKWMPSIDKKIYDDVVGGTDFNFFIDHSAPTARKLVMHPNPVAEAKTRFDAVPAFIDLPNDSRGAALALHTTLTEAAKAQAPGELTTTNTKEQ